MFGVVPSRRILMISVSFDLLVYVYRYVRVLPTELDTWYRYVPKTPPFRVGENVILQQ